MGKTKGKVRIDDKFFDCEQFYSILKNLGKLYASDKQIAAVLNIAPETFSRMKNGKYPSWTEEENRERSGRINQVLTGARENANTLLLDSYFNLATGKATSKTYKYVQERCDCDGADKKCPYCGGTGWVSLTDKVIVQEQVLPPNPQAITTLLRHYSENWKETEDPQAYIEIEYARLTRMLDELPDEALDKITQRINLMHEKKSELELK